MTPERIVRLAKSVRGLVPYSADRGHRAAVLALAYRIHGLAKMAHERE